MMLSSDSLEIGTGSSNSLPSANESLRTDAPSSREEFIEEWRRERDISFYRRERRLCRAAAAAVSDGGAKS
jgi:hypothetical protein